MTMHSTTTTSPQSQPSGCVVSPLVIADRLLTLAQDADSAGLHRSADSLIRMAFDMCDEPPMGSVLSGAWARAVRPNA
jgi:hypothetical protein